MYAHFKLKLILILPLLSPASDSDFLWPPAGNSLFSDPNITLGEASFVDSAKLPEHQDLFFEDLDNSIDLPSSDTGGLMGSLFFNDDAQDQDFELAECSSSQTSSAIGISRVKRLDQSGNCKTSTTQPDSSSDDDFKESIDLLSGDLNILDKLTEAMKNKAANTRCVFYTLSILPWGVCSSGWPPDEIPMGRTIDIPTRGVFDLYVLEYYKLGKL